MTLAMIASMEAAPAEGYPPDFGPVAEIPAIPEPISGDQQSEGTVWRFGSWRYLGYPYWNRYHHFPRHHFW